VEALQQLVSACQAISSHLAAGLDREVGDDAMRQQLEGLLLSQAKWEAEMEALVMKAEGAQKAALNAESRSRTMMKHAEKLADPLGLEGEEVEEDVREGYAPGVEEEGMLPLRLDVAPTHKEIALRYKFS